MLQIVFLVLMVRGAGVCILKCPLICESAGVFFKSPARLLIKVI